MRAVRLASSLIAISMVALGCDGPAVLPDAALPDAALPDAALPTDAASDGGADGGSHDAGGDATAPDAALEVELTVTLSGIGTGNVSSEPAGIDCGSACTALLPRGAVVLTATPDAGSAFVGWGGACSGSDATCTLTLDADASVTAEFARFETLTVSTDGNGAGTVASPAGIDCGDGATACELVVERGADVTLTATPATGSDFVGWTGACSGTGACVVSVDAATSVGATFALQRFAVSVVLDGTGNGWVGSTPGGIDCHVGTCTADFDHGTMLSLDLLSAPDASFTGWSGPCTGTGACAFTVTGPETVTATFTQNPSRLTVHVEGAGRLTSVPSGIDCTTAVCDASFDAGTVVTLTPTPEPGWSFAGWVERDSSRCTSSPGACTIALTTDVEVTARFVPRPTLTIVQTGRTASAVVSSSPSGINCGATCSATFDYGTAVTLTTSGTIVGWSGGGCSGTGPCTTTLTGDVTVTANYRALRVGVHAPSGSCLRASGNAIDVATALMTARGFAVTAVTGAQIDTLAELSAYDVIVTPGPGNDCVGNEWAAVDAAIDPYVRGGGGVVASGWLLIRSGTVGWNLLNVLPVYASTDFVMGDQTVTPVMGFSPITSGVGTFTAEEWVPYGGLRLGATALLTAGGRTVGAAQAVGTGRGVYLGPMYMETYASYRNESLLDGTQPAAIEIFLRSIEWAGRAR